MNSIVIKKTQIANAISMDEIQPFIQPIVNRNKNLIGFEVLARWIVSEYETRLPLQFIPIIKDDQQLSESLTISLLQQLITHFLSHKNNNIYISINIYSHSLTTLVINLLIKLNKYINVVVEILEDDDINNRNEFKIILHYLKSKGIKIALDDFGCGNNINDRLFDYPFDYVKIDKLFISDIDIHSDKLKSLKAMMKIIHYFNLPIIAEGVENEHVFNVLTMLNIEMYQGYLFSKPIPLSDQQYQSISLINDNKASQILKRII